VYRSALGVLLLSLLLVTGCATVNKTGRSVKETVGALGRSGLASSTGATLGAFSGASVGIYHSAANAWVGNTAAGLLVGWAVGYMLGQSVDRCMASALCRDEQAFYSRHHRYRLMNNLMQSSYPQSSAFLLPTRQVPPWPVYQGQKTLY
jgi:hypothetical protein